MSTLSERLKSGDKVKCLKGDGVFYLGGEIYKVGKDSDGDFGVFDSEGDVMAFGRISSEQGAICKFSDSRWELVVETKDVEVQVTEVEPMTVDQLTAFLDGYIYAGGDVNKMVTITFEGDK